MPYIPYIYSRIHTVQAACTSPTFERTFIKLYNKQRNTDRISKVKAIPIQAWTGPEGSRRLRFAEFLHNPNMKVARFSVRCTGCLYPPGDTTGTHLLEAESIPGPQCGRDRTRDLQACNAVPKPTVSLRTIQNEYFIFLVLFSWRYNPLWLYFNSPVAGFSLLVFEISWSHTTTRHSR